MATSVSRIVFVLAGLLFLGAAGTRLIAIGNQPLVNDEAFSALIASLPFTELIADIALDVHPPFYYLALSVW